MPLGGTQTNIIYLNSHGFVWLCIKKNNRQTRYQLDIIKFPFKIYLCKKMQVKVKRTITSILGTSGLWMARVMMFGEP